MKSLIHRKWLYRLCGSIVVLALLVAGTNLIVDPYGIYRLISIPGFNANKHIAIKHTRIYKPYLVQKLKPQAIATGSSRSEVAIDPAHPGWPESTRPVFNYSFPGTTIQELTYWMRHALETAPIKKVVFGLDFHLFHSEKTYEGEWQGVWDVYLKTLLSLDSVLASRKSLVSQDPIEDPGLLPNGQLAWTVNQRRVQKTGHRQDFVGNEKALKKTLSKRSKGEPYVTKEALETFESLLTQLRQKEIDVTFYIFPVHVRWLEVFYQTGHWDEYLQWQKQLVDILERHNRDVPESTPYRLYDFSGVNEVTTETVPELGDTETNMNYYWETSHTKKSAGDLILDRIFAYQSPDRPDYKGFGVLLDGNNIETYLAQKSETFMAFREMNPEMVNEIEEMKY